MTSVALLRCSHCDAVLAGRDADLVWTCSPCGRAYEAEETALAVRPFRALAPPEGRARSERTPGRSAEGAHPKCVWLPFWRLAFRPEVEGEGALAVQELRRVSAPGRAWVRAFWIDGAFNIGDPGQAMTAEPFEERWLDGPPPEAPGTCIGLREAWRIAELFFLGAADRKGDVTGVRLHLSPVDAALVAVPYVDLGAEVGCPITGRSFRKSVLGVW